MSDHVFVVTGKFKRILHAIYYVFFNINKYINKTEHETINNLNKIMSDNSVDENDQIVESRQRVALWCSNRWLRRSKGYVKLHKQVFFRIFGSILKK